jgi:hypothetical protein
VRTANYFAMRSLSHCCCGRIAVDHDQNGQPT